jgi:hypothetical protein
MKIYQELASLILAIDNCTKHNNHEWRDKHEEKVYKILRAGPSGSGIDSGISILWDKCKPDVIFLLVPFHVMDGNGFYTGWIDYKIKITPCLSFGYHIHIYGRDKNGIKDYLYDIVSCWLGDEYIND